MIDSLDIRRSSYQKIREILEVTAQTTRKTLKCDRVIVYDASELPKGRVIAESVSPEYDSILGEAIEDPFLSGEYLELYCYGRAIALDDIDNIKSTNVASSQLENLRQLKITGLAVAPIVTGNELLALLVAHQCSGQPWHSQTSNLLTQKANTASYVLASIVPADFQPSATAQQENGTPTMELSNNGGNQNPMHTEQQTHLLEDNSAALAEVIDKISGEAGQENLLDTAVSEVRNLLQCDRVVIYSLNENNYGVIVAESVAAGWTRALGNTIDDPCMAVRYVEEYRNGRVHAIDDISSGQVTTCYREQLEELEVKANLVAPVIGEGQLFGLLIAHQCDAPRQWQEREIAWITEIASQVGLMLEYTDMLTETDLEEAQLLAAKDEKWNEHFADAIQYIRQSLTKKDILKASVKEVRRILECDRVVIYSLDCDFRYSEVIAESVAPGLTRALNKKIDDPCFEPTYREKYLNGRVRAWNNIYESGMTRCYIEQLEKLEVKANLVAPVISEGTLIGLLVAHQCSDFRDWQQAEIRWTAQIATQVGFALDNAKLLSDAQQLQHQLENEVKLTQYYTDAVRYIRESLHREDILEVSVEEVRRVLNCDRVVVYSMNSDNRGEIVAESVAPGWTRTQSRVIEDPCFESRYLDKYRNGRVRAWSNIYEAGMTRCYIEQLEKIEVKANLVTPIISEGKLFGLLVAHQCSDFRQWQQPEIRWTTQVATQVGFALDNAKLLADARKLQQQVKDESKWTEYLTDATQHIRQSLKTGDILNTSVKEVRRILDCDRVVIYSMKQEIYGTIVAESVAPGWTRSMGRVINDPCFNARHREHYRQGRVRAWSNIYESGLSQCYIEQLEQLEVKANLAVPVISEGKLFGLLFVHQCSDFREWQQPEIRWTTQIATQVGFALDNAKLLKQLQESSKTSDRVVHQQQEQTEALKHQVVDILGDNGDAYQTLSQEAMRQSETTIEVLHHIQKVADSFDGIALSVQQVKFQQQQQNTTVQDTKESLERSIKSILNIQRTVQNAVGFDNFGHSSQKLLDTVSQIRDLSKQLVQQSMSLTRAVNRSQIEPGDRNSVMDLSDAIFSLMQDLFEASAKVEPLFNNIHTETREKTMTLDGGIQQLMNGVEEFQAVRQKLDRVVALNQKINTPIENISRAVENQTQSSIFAKNSVQEVASIAERISEQSTTISQSFDRLVELIQKL